MKEETMGNTAPVSTNCVVDQCSSDKGVVRICKRVICDKCYGDGTGWELEKCNKCGVMCGPRWRLPDGPVCSLCVDKMIHNE